MELVQCKAEEKQKISKMIMELINFHRKLTSSPEEFWCKHEEAEATFEEWFNEGKIFLIVFNKVEIGFFYVRFGGNNAAWLEDLYISNQHRGKGYGKEAMLLLDKNLREMKITALFVDVIPRNTRALEFYKEAGFDHLNMIQLRKNYDSRLNKNDEVEILGHKFKKY